MNRWVVELDDDLGGSPYYDTATLSPRGVLADPIPTNLINERLLDFTFEQFLLAIL